jgi:hypothetical protein
MRTQCLWDLRQPWIRAGTLHLSGSSGIDAIGIPDVLEISDGRLIPDGQGCRTRNLNSKLSRFPFAFDIGSPSPCAYLDALAMSTHSHSEFLMDRSPGPDQTLVVLNI